MFLLALSLRAPTRNPGASSPPALLAVAHTPALECDPPEWGKMLPPNWFQNFRFSAAVFVDTSSASFDAVVAERETSSRARTDLRTRTRPPSESAVGHCSQRNTFFVAIQIVIHSSRNAVVPLQGSAADWALPRPACEYFKNI